MRIAAPIQRVVAALTSVEDHLREVRSHSQNIFLVNCSVNSVLALKGAEQTTEHKLDTEDAGD